MWVPIWSVFLFCCVFLFGSFLFLLFMFFCVLFSAFCFSVSLFCWVSVFLILMVEKKKDTKAKMQVGFICTQILNEQSQQVLVAQLLKKIERVSNSEQPDISARYVQKLHVYEPISLLQLQTQVDAHMNSLEFPLEFVTKGD